MTDPSLAELTAPSRSGWALARDIAKTIAVILVIVVGVLLYFSVEGLRTEAGENKRDLIDAGKGRLDRSLDEHTRTQTMICMAHKEERMADPIFDGMCSDVIARWGVADTSNMLGGG